MPTRRTILRAASGLAPWLGLGLAGCVAYPDYAGYPPVVASIPTMVWLPSPGVYIATDYPGPLFYAGGSYYYPYRNRWYAGPGYRGPWRPLAGPPPQLRGYQPNTWRNYQSRANSYYRGNPNWQHFRPHR